MICTINSERRDCLLRICEPGASDVLPPAALVSIAVAVPVVGQAQAVSRSPRELGVSVLRELSIGARTVTFRVDSGGCTDRASFTVRVRTSDEQIPGTPHYRLTIERTTADTCKALLLEGVVIELDIVRDIGLTLPCTFSIDNPVMPDRPSAQAGTTPNDAVRQATLNAIDLEIATYKDRLKTAQAGAGTPALPGNA